MRIAIRKKRKSGLNLTPLIDVLFILIIFFSVSSTFLEQPGIELKLPEAESAVDLPREENIIYVDSKEQIYLNDKLIAIDSLAAAVLTLLENDEDKSITLNADSNVKHGKIIAIMDLLRKEGVYKISVATVKPPVER